MASSWRQPRREDNYDDDEEEDYEEEEEEDDDYEEQEDDDEGTEEGTTGENSPTPYNMELHSMTAKGIKHLCSELLEINEASQEDFQRNVHLTYLSFVRLFQEAGDLEKDVDHLKRQAMAQRSLIQQLTDNIYSSSMVPDNSAIDPFEFDVCSPTPVDPVDVLLSEHRMEEALELLEVEGQALDELHSDDARVIASSMSALSARRARVADGFASLADSPRKPPRRELLRALSGLCKLGDSQRANHILFKFYRSDALRRVDELRCSSSSHRNYIKELACTVFSSVLEASRSFVALHGRGQPSPELSRWAREEIDDFIAAFREYVGSISEAGSGDGLALATEAANCAVSYSSMLRTVVPEEDILALIRPCMEKVLATYTKHMKKVVRLLVSSDAWVLGKFLMSGILRRRTPSPLPPNGGETEHCLLTASGRKFSTLMQEVVEDVSPLLRLGMKSSVLQLLSGLFREYTHSVLAVDVVDQQQQYMWQLSFLINCTTLVSLFPIIAHGVFKSNNSQVSTNQAAQTELDGLTLFIKEASGQVWTQFCQQFIRDTMSSLQDRSRTHDVQGGTMPCSAFQVVFLRLRRLSDLYGVILAGKDGTMRKLLQQLMEAIIIWLHNNLDTWIFHHAQNNLPRDTLLHQIQLDVNFLLQVAQFCGFSSHSIRTSALDLLSKAEEKVSSLEQSMTSGAIHEEAWATDAAKRAVQVLTGDGVNSSSSQDDVANSEEDVLKAGGVSMTTSAQESDEEIDNRIDDSVAGSGQSDTPEAWSDEHAGSRALGDSGGDGKSSDEFVSIEVEDDGGAAEGSTEDGVSPASPIGTSVLDSEKHKLLVDNIPIDVHGDSLNGLGGSGAAMEATPCDPQEDEDDDESALPEFLQDKMNPIPVISDQSGTDTTSVSSAEMESGDQHSDPGSGSSGGHGWRRRAGAPAAAKGDGGIRKKREGLSRNSRPRWRQ
ncbi:hypothetical protein ACQ4PT_052359 [Festuca glaucescens]